MVKSVKEVSAMLGNIESTKNALEAFTRWTESGDEAKALCKRIEKESGVNIGMGLMSMALSASAYLKDYMSVLDTALQRTKVEI